MSYHQAIQPYLFMSQQQYKLGVILVFKCQMQQWNPIPKQRSHSTFLISLKNGSTSDISNPFSTMCNAVSYGVYIIKDCVKYTEYTKRKDTCSFHDRLTRWIQVKVMIPYWCHLLNPLQSVLMNGRRQVKEGFLSLEKIETWICARGWMAKYLSTFERGTVVGARRTSLCQEL